MKNILSINLCNWSETLNSATPALIDRAAALGFTGVELPLCDPTQRQVLHACAQRIRALALAPTLCAWLSPGRDISSFDEDIRKNTLTYFENCLAAAQTLGAGLLAGPLYAGGGKRHHLPKDECEREWALAVEGLRSVAREASKRGVTLAIEPLNRYRTSVVNTAAQAVKMIRDIGEPNVLVHFDTYQACIEEDSLTGALEMVLKEKLLGHFHACANHRGPPGSGHLPWETLFSLLHRLRYRGHITMETFAPGGLDSGFLPQPKNPDEIARAGLWALKKLIARA